MARGESRKRKPGTPDYRKRFWAAVTAIVVAAGSIGVSHAGFTLPNQAQKQVQMAAAETEPAEQTAKKQVPNAAKRSLELEDAQGIQEADAAAVADQSELESDKTTASGFQSVDETVYATENLLNVRSGCGTEYEIVTQLNQGDSVQRVGIGDGWSEVLYKDKSCFIRSEYLTTTEPGSEEATVTARGQKRCTGCTGVQRTYRSDRRGTSGKGQSGQRTSWTGLLDHEGEGGFRHRGRIDEAAGI